MTVEAGEGGETLKRVSLIKGLSATAHNLLKDCDAKASVRKMPGRNSSEVAFALPTQVS